MELSWHLHTTPNVYCTYFITKISMQFCKQEWLAHTDITGPWQVSNMTLQCLLVKFFVSCQPWYACLLTCQFYKYLIELQDLWSTLCNFLYMLSTKRRNVMYSHLASHFHLPRCPWVASHCLLERISLHSSDFTQSIFCVYVYSV